MNSTPKQQDGDDGGVAPASGARASLEQTVLGVAPAPNAAISNAAAPNAAVSNSAAPGTTEPSPQPAMPPPLDSTALPPPPVSFVPAASGEPPAAALIAAPVIVVAAPSSASSSSAHPGSVSPGSAHSGPEQRGLSRDTTSAPAPSSLAAPVTAPIPLIHVVAPVEVASPPRPAPRAPAAGVDTTLPVGGAPMPGVQGAVAPHQPAEDANVQRTALSEDYLREARQAALDAVARSAPPAAGGLGIGDTVPSIAQMDAAPPSFGTRPSIVATPLSREGDPSSTHDAVAIKSSRGFEPVPVLRAPLSESLSGGLGPVAEVGGHRNGGPPSSARSRAALPTRRSGDSVLRWLLLAAVALVSVASVMVGQRVWQRYREPVSPQLAAVAPGQLDGVSSSAASTSRALMPSRPPAEATPAGRAVVVSVTGGQADDTAGPAGAGPEAQLAATAGRHVIAGNYADALPLYQQLERAYPDNSAYVAMTRLLEKKVGTSNDTRTVTPAPSKPVKR